MEEIIRYFPTLSRRQQEQLEAFGPKLLEWNTRINLISRKDTEAFYTRHVLHSLAIGLACQFDAGSRVLDVGCGGGFPGIPLAILFPETHFTLVDSIGKKIMVVNDLIAALDIQNAEGLNKRAEQVPGDFDYVVSRAVTRMNTFIPWIWDKIRPGQAGSLPNGILYLKGGDLSEELAETGHPYRLFDIGTWFGDEFFATKRIVYIKKG